MGPPEHLTDHIAKYWGAWANRQMQRTRKPAGKVRSIVSSVLHELKKTGLKAQTLGSLCVTGRLKRNENRDE